MHQMMKSRQYKIIQWIGGVLLLSCAIIQIRFAFMEQEIFIGKSDVETAVKLHDAQALTNLAKQKHLFEADLNGAQVLLQKALESNPYFIPAWLALSELRNDYGDKRQSFKILNYAHELSEDIKRWRWEKTLTAYQLGRNDLLKEELNYIISEISGKPRQDALQLAFSIWPDPGELLDNIGLENINLLFSKALKANAIESVLYLWAVIENESIEYEVTDLLKCIELLIRSGKIKEAGHLWRKHINPTQKMYNGDFQQNFLQRAFGWRSSKVSGVVQSLEKQAKNAEQGLLHLRFKGWQNINFVHLYQIVPLEGGEVYELNLQYKTNKLTTDQRPYIEVSAYQCDTKSHTKSVMFDASREWSNLKLSFGVPEDCSAARVRFRRNESTQIDSKISGHLWIKNVEIHSTGVKFFIFDDQSI